MHLTVPASLLYILLMGFISVVNAAPATIKVAGSANSNIVSESHLESRTGEHHQAGEGVQHFPMIAVYITAIRAAVITTGQSPDKQLKFQDEAVQSRLEARLKFYFQRTWKYDAVINFVGNLEFKMVDVEGGFSFEYKQFPNYKKIKGGFVSESNPPSPLGSSYDSLNSDTYVKLQVPQRS
ncbi:hypothetical protein C8J55DRAFT_37580 [Lentinula edodes]|uniref:Uncharacterized protein n=1 Tax=Lentinula lateritia TaxID=40482 RepID=A0A9W9DTT6_9AGAR|nr:hypothetical protein C8J55DRAFT_37580 [Lentinula edodes]